MIPRRVPQDLFQNSLDTLSRLKGIETERSQAVSAESEVTLDTLSRLKGIETCH